MGGNYERGMYNQLMEVMARLDMVEKEHKKEVFRLKDEISDLKKENQRLLDENAHLKNIINHNSSNTSRPPSTDQKGGKAVNTYHGRQKTSRKAGGQNGHKGTTLTKAEVEEKIRSGRCRHEIKTIGNPKASVYVTKYIVDLNVETVITEVRIYADKDGNIPIPPECRSDVVYGANVKALAVALYSEGVMSNDRIAAFLNAAGGDALGLSEGSVYSFCRKLAEASEESVRHLEEFLLKEKVVATDATTVTVNGKQNYIRNFSTENTVVYHAMNSKSIPVLEKLPFLLEFGGILLHDHETALYHFGTGHAECNVHIIRYLRKNTEETGNGWSGEMIRLLCGMNTKRKELMDRGERIFSEETITEYEGKYRELIQKGRKENKKTPHKYARQDERALLNRMEAYSENHLLFLHDFDVPFDNNISERDLRKAKNRQKMAGGFRKESGNAMYCIILTMIETLKKRKMGMIENLRKLYMGASAIF